MRPWSADLKYVQNPDLMLREAVTEVTVGADIHKSRSDLNIHQFRRGSRVPEDRTSKKRKKCSRQSNRSSSSLSYTQVHQYQTFRPSERNTSNFLLASRKPSVDSSWKEVVSDLMDVLRVQVTASYRKTANVVPQTIEDVFRPPEPPKVNQPEEEDVVKGRH